MLEAYKHVLEISTQQQIKNQIKNQTSPPVLMKEIQEKKIPTMIPQIIITPPLEIISENNTDIPELPSNPITSEQSNLTTNNENRNKHAVTKINHPHPSETNQSNLTIPEESSTEKEIILI